MIPTNFLFTLLVILITGSGKLLAQKEVINAGGSVTIVTNPAYFILGGYHLKPSYHFPKKWSVGATLQGGFELPDFARNQFFEINGNEAISVDWTYAIGLELKYRFTETNYDKGFFTAINLGYEGWEVKGEATDTFENWFASIDVGYNWYPFKKQRFHIGVSYTLIFILNNTEERAAGGDRYNIRSLVPPSFLPSILAGWRF